MLTPGVKDPNADYESQKGDEGQPETSFEVVNSITFIRGRKPADRGVATLIATGRHVSFSKDIKEFQTPAYSSIYGMHPRYLAATHQAWREVSEHRDPYTATSARVMATRHARLSSSEARERIRLHRQTMLQGFIHDIRTQALLKSRSKDLLAAVRTTPAKKSPTKKGKSQGREGHGESVLRIRIGPGTSNQLPGAFSSHKLSVTGSRRCPVRREGTLSGICCPKQKLLQPAQTSRPLLSGLPKAGPCLPVGHRG